MSGLEVASGIAGLIALTIQVAGVVAEYSTAVKDHSKNIKELHDELSLLGNVLSRLNDFITSDQARSRAFAEDSILVNAVGDCKRRIERIGDKLKPSSGGRVARTIDRLKWPFEQKDVLQLIENLGRYIHTFEFALTIKNSEFLWQNSEDANKSLKELQKRIDQSCETNRLLGDPIDKLLERSQGIQEIVDILPKLLQQSNDLGEVTQVVKLAEQREQERRRSDILDWLIPISTLQKHVDLQTRRAAGTCRWLLENEMFLDWCDSDRTQYDMLCQGGPGVGKTVLCSIVIDHLRMKFKDEDVAVVYYYFDLAEQQAQTEYSLTKSILRQLCQHTPSVPNSVADFYQRTRNELQDSLWLQELQTILQRVIATFSQCFVIIDAFDELETKKRGAVDGVLEILKTSNACVKFFATSRPHVVLGHFQDVLTIDVRADESDLRGFLSQKISDHPHAMEILDELLKQQMLDRLCSHADGMFLLPALQIDQILDQAVSPGDIERAITNLSTNLKEVFQSTITRIEGFAGGKRNLAFKTLMWLSHARRPLRISELQHAIAVRYGRADFDKRDVSSILLIIDSCCGLIELDGENACVKFVHGSIAEYLRVGDHGFFKDAEVEIVRTCLKYLTMDHLRTLPSKPRSEFLKAMESYPLLEYASSFWGYHAYGVEVRHYQDLALSLCTSSPHLLATARVRDIRSPELRKWGERMLMWSESGGGGISLASSFGLTDLTRLLISQQQHPILNAKNIYGSTPLHICAIFGFESTAEVLLAHGADPLEPNNGKATPFYLAVSYGQLELCKTLLKYDKSQLSAKCKDDNIALHKAADIGSAVMVEFLLQAGSPADAQNHQGMTPIHFAARRGYTNIVQMLTLAGANVQITNSMFITPLDLAALGGHQEVVQFLLQQNVNVNQKSREEWTPLHRAARSGHTETVKLLLAAGADVMSLDKQRSIPFQLAIKSGNLDTVKVILYHDMGLVRNQLIQRDWKKDQGIDIAFYTSQYHIYEHLRDVETEFADPRVQIPIDPLLPLSRAIEQGNLAEVQQILQKYPAWLTAKDHFNQMPLHTAFRTQQWAIAEYMLSQGASINSRGYHNWTPLHLAAASGNLRMLSLALQWDADLFLTSDTLQTPLHKAASSGSIIAVLELLRCGCDPSAKNDRAMTPVHVAARTNFIDGVLVMIQHTRSDGSSYRDLLFAQDKFGRTPRAWAERAGYLENSAVLRDEERRAKGRPTKSDHLTHRHSPSLSPSLAHLSRQSTMDTLSRRSTGITTSTVPTTPALERSLSSLDELSGFSSPRRSPATPTPLVRGSSMDEVEKRYAEMQLEYDSD